MRLRFAFISFPVNREDVEYPRDNGKFEDLKTQQERCEPAESASPTARLEEIEASSRLTRGQEETAVGISLLQEFIRRRSHLLGS